LCKSQAKKAPIWSPASSKATSQGSLKFSTEKVTGEGQGASVRGSPHFEFEEEKIVYNKNQCAIDLIFKK
jgi:hypothetical protein